MKIDRKKLKTEIVRYAKYAITGGVGNAVNFSVLWLLTDIAHFHYMISACLAIVAAATNNYIINHFWAFKDSKDRNNNKKIGWAKFVAAKAIGDLAYLGLLGLFTDVVGIWYLLSAGLATALTAIPGYFLVAWWVWDRKVWKVKEIES